MPDKRATGVSALGYISCIVGICFLIGVILMLVPSAFSARFKEGLNIFIAMIFLVIAVIDLVIGIGLLKLKNWARNITVVLSILICIFDLLKIFKYIYNPILLISALLRPVIAIIIIWYLTRPAVREQFK